MEYHLSDMPAEAEALERVLITAELNQRPARLPHYQAEATALGQLARLMADGTAGLLEALADTAVALCHAGTGGVSVPGPDAQGTTVYHWVALAGRLAAYRGATTPLDFSPCGVAQARGAPQLFAYPGRYFPSLAAADPPIVEGLVVPLDVADATLGTIWVLTHDDRRHFDAEDVRLLTSLAAFTAAALRLSRLAGENARLYREVQATLRVHDELLDTIVHDLRGPLTGVKAYTQLTRRKLRRGAAVDELDDGLGQIERLADRLDAQLGELADVARVRGVQPLELHRRPTDLVALARDVSSPYAARGRGIAVIAAVPSAVGDWDPVRLTRALDNLVGNAVKYSAESSPIEIAISLDGDRAVLCIRDEGIGIPAADLPAIFEPFRRAANAARRASGTGLGLAGVRRIIEAHGGTIGLDSVEGQGTTVTVTLPLAVRGN